MKGPKRARKAMEAYLRVAVPDEAARFIAEQEVDEEFAELVLKVAPDDASKPGVSYMPRPPKDLDRWPIVAVSAVRKPRLRRTDHGETEQSYLATYAMRVFVWVRTPEWGPVFDWRDDLMAIVERALVRWPSLSKGIGTLDDVQGVDESTLISEFSDVVPVKGNRYVAGGYLAIDLVMVEDLPHEGLGTVGSVVAEVSAHPAL